MNIPTGMYLSRIIVKDKKSTMGLKRNLPLLCMTVPFFMLVVVFAYVPLWGWSIAFTDFSPGTGIFETGFVGLKYF